MADIKSAFINRHFELRSGWRILLFLIITSAVVFVGAFPIRAIGSMVQDSPVAPLLARMGVLLMLAGALLASYLLTRFVNRKPFQAIGLWFHPRAMMELGWGVLLGFVAMGAIFISMFLMGSVEITQRDMSTGDAILIVGTSGIMFAVAAMSEEVIFRGYPFQTLIQGITLLPAVILMAVIFAFAHFSNPNATTFGIINIAFAAVMLSVAYVKTKGLWLPFGFHFSWNFSQTTIFSFPTSGISFEGQKLFVTTVSGEQWITGGTFGPEGGALATGAIVAGTWYILKSNRFVAPEGVITLDSIEDLVQPETLEKAGTD